MATKSKHKLEDYYKDNRFDKIFLRTEKYREFYATKESYIALFLAITTSYIFNLLIESNVSGLIDDTQELLIAIIGGLFGLLGLTIGGLAIILGTIGNNVVKKIDDKLEIDNLMSVIFNFYFAGALNGITVLICIFSYLFTLFPQGINRILFCLMAFINAYFFYFSVIFSIMLLGTCIRLFLLNYFYTHDKGE